MNNVNPNEAAKTAAKLLEELGYDNYFVGVSKKGDKKVRQEGIINGDGEYAIHLMQAMIDGVTKEMTRRHFNNVLKKFFGGMK